jgi:hypothetical protein
MADLEYLKKTKSLKFNGLYTLIIFLIRQVDLLVIV